MINNSRLQMSCDFTDVNSDHMLSHSTYYQSEHSARGRCFSDCKRMDYQVKTTLLTRSVKYITTEHSATRGTGI